MNAITVLTLMAVLSSSSVRPIDCLPFCDYKSFDSVFNIGPVVHFVRCGEVWTFNPHLEAGDGGFLRDWSLFSHARHWFGGAVLKNYGSYHDQWLRFSGFSFQGITCLTNGEDLNKTCFKSIQDWNRLTILFDNSSAVPFYMGPDYEVDHRNRNPLGFKARQRFDDISDQRNLFLPNVRAFLGSQADLKAREFVAALYDYKKQILYMGLRYKRLNCLTYLKMNKMLHNRTEWPVHKPEPPWSVGKCAPGKLIGMFYHKNQAYVVGRVNYGPLAYEDQVYKMSVNGKASIEVEEIYYKTNDPKDGLKSDPHDLKTFFGCVREDKNTAKTKRSVPEEVAPVERVEPMSLLFNNNKVLTLLLVCVLCAAFVRYFNGSAGSIGGENKSK